MSLNDIVAEFRANPLVTREIPGLGALKFKRLTVADVFGFPEAGNFGVQMVMAATMDADGNPLFASPKEVEGLEYGIFRALLAACQAVNTL